MGEECRIVPEKTFLKIRGSDKTYEEALEASAKFNKQLCSERKMRIPFIDSQTRVAQSNSLLWYMEYQRARGAKLGQIVSYPVKKWYKNRRRFLDTDSNVLPHRMATPVDTNENSNSMDAFAAGHAQHALQKQSSNSVDDDHHVGHNHKGGASAPAAAVASSANTAAAVDDWHMHHDDSFDNFDMNDDNESDGEDYEESRKRKGKKQSKLSNKKKSSSAAAAAAADAHDDKPFACDRCGMKYKTKPGLSYHIQKTHASTSKPSEVINADENANSVFESVYEDMNSSSSFPHVSSSNNLAHGNAGSNSATGLSNANGHAVTATGVLKNPFGKQCGVCLGSDQENRSGQPEPFVICCECTKNFHPSCLNFTANMVTSTKKYNWQCVDCKHCTICGNSENDDKLLFCDDCDRGYHMYCLKPPLTEAPDGDWRCELCIKEYGPQ